VHVDVRIISATNRDLAAQVKAGEFREDLFYRLNVFPIEVPSLTARMEDVPLLLEHFIARFNAQEGRRIQGATAETLAMLKAFDWPGNVRQLENAVFRAVVLCDGDLLQLHDFPQISGIMPELPEPSDDDRAHEAAAVAADAAPLAVPGAGSKTGTAEDAPVAIFDGDGELRTLDEIERDLIQFAIEVYSGHMSEVARRLGIGRSTLYRKVREHDLDVEHSRAG